MKVRANVNTSAAAHRLPTKNILATSIIACTYAYNSSIILAFPPFLTDTICEIIASGTAMTIKVNNTSTGTVTTSNVLLSHLLLSSFSSYGNLHSMTHSFLSRYSCCPPGVLAHEVHVVGVYDVQVEQTGLQAGHVLFEAS